jgi:hypothetical protein
MLRLADRIVIIDDASTDGTADACAARGDRVNVHRLSSSLFQQESALRSRLWDAIRSEALAGDWIGLFDGDEIPSEPLIAAASYIRGLPPSVERLDAHLAELWDERSYRVDGLWSPWIPFFVRFRDAPYLPSLDGAPALHASRVPDYTKQLVPAPLDAPVLHLGYSRTEDRRAKADFYLRRNTGTNLHHARTVLSAPALRPVAELLDVPDLLVAVPIRDRAWMVPALTRSLERLAWPRERLRGDFQLNDSHDDTGELLDRWVQGPGRGCAEIEETSLPHSVAGEHEWAGPPWDPDGPLKRMTQLRNRALELLRCTGAGALLSLDSDVILDPRTPTHLHGAPELRGGRGLAVVSRRSAPPPA